MNADLIQPTQTAARAGSKERRNDRETSLGSRSSSLWAPPGEERERTGEVLIADEKTPTVQGGRR